MALGISPEDQKAARSDEMEKAKEGEKQETNLGGFPTVPLSHSGSCCSVCCTQGASTFFFFSFTFKLCIPLWVN